MRKLTAWIKTVPTLVIIGTVLCMVLTVGGGLLIWGSHFATDMVHKQLSAQQISFPAKGSPALDPKEFPGLQQYAGQTVDNGPKAKAYADQFIKKHLEGVANGQTYSQVSGQVQAAFAKGQTPPQKLLDQQNTLFKGETLRGLLLNVWGWATMGAIAYWVGIAALLGALFVFLGLVLGFVLHERKIHQTVEAITTSEPVPAM